MVAATRATVVGVFNNHEQAENAFSELRRAGFSHDQLGIVTRNAQVNEEAEQVSGGTGAATGAAAGAGIGALGGLAVAVGMLPAIGPVLAGGTLAAIIASAATGAAAGGVLGALVDLGVPEDAARHYESEVRRGRVLITVRADDRQEEAITILRQCGGLTAFQ